MMSCCAFSHIINKKRYRDLFSVLTAAAVVVLMDKLSPKSLHLIMA
jgi:hypothetical protein